MGNLTSIHARTKTQVENAGFPYFFWVFSLFQPLSVNFCPKINYNPLSFNRLRRNL